MKNLLRKVLLAAVLIVASVCVIAAETAVKPVKYVFLFIGDGMSMPQRITADKFNQALGNNENVLEGEISIRAWNENGNKVLATWRHNDKTTWHILDLENIEKSINLNEKFGP